MTETIYRITNTINNDCYIGKTSDIKRRYKQHLSCASRNSQCYIHNAIRKYGKENFIIEELETTTELEVNNRERYWIALLHPKYNMTPGGDGGAGIGGRIGTPLSEDHKAKISKSMIGKNSGNKGRIPWNKGKKINRNSNYKREYIQCSNETRLKISNANKGKFVSDETKAKMAAARKAYCATSEGIAHSKKLSTIMHMARYSKLQS